MCANKKEQEEQKLMVGFVCDEFDNFIKRCRREIPNDSLTGYIALHYLVDKITENEGADILKRWVKQAITAKEQDETNRKKH